MYLCLSSPSWSWSYGSKIYNYLCYHHLCCEFEFHSWRGVLDTTLCDRVCQWLVIGCCISPGTLVSSINKTDRHDIIEIILKVVLNTIMLLIVMSIRTNILWCYNMTFSSLETIRHHKGKIYWGLKIKNNIKQIFINE